MGKMIETFDENGEILNVGGNTLIKKIGSGSFASVWLAHRSVKPGALKDDRCSQSSAGGGADGEMLRRMSNSSIELDRNSKEYGARLKHAALRLRRSKVSNASFVSSDSFHNDDDSSAMKTKEYWLTKIFRSNEKAKYDGNETLSLGDCSEEEFVAVKVFEKSLLKVRQYEKIPSM